MKYSFAPNINIFVGKNGTGKTSVIEALGYLFIGKSFKKAKDPDCLKAGATYFSIVGECFLDEKPEKIILYYDKNGKKITINNKKESKISLFASKKALVSFSPEDLGIIKGSPSDRRRFLDVSLIQIDEKYADTLNKYNKIIKERNEYLKTVDNKDVDFDFLDVLDKQIIETGKQIVKKREEFVMYLCRYINMSMQTISKNKDTISIRYIPKVSVENFECEFLKRRKYDVYLQTTTLGPHRDDLEFLINSISGECASQGQIRCAVLSLIISYYKYLKSISKPLIVAMDDVLSELDEERKNDFFRLIDNEDQIFITCTDLNSVSNEIVEKSNVIYVGKEQKWN